MNIEEVRDYCLSLKNVTEAFPFDETTLVFKVENKMFLMIDLNESDNIAVKCDPEQAEILRDKYEAVVPGWHLNKKYWNDIYLESDMADDEICRWIRHSYQEVIKKLPKKIREEYADK